MKTLGNVLIIGDSYSTFTGGFLYKGCPSYYPNGDVDCVEKTWWHRLIKRTNATLICNNSFSGSTVCNTGYDGWYCPDSSFIGRMQQCVENGDAANADTVFVFGGTNDSWAGSPLGEIKYGEKTEEDLKAFLPAFCHLIEYIREQLPCARIISIINSGLSDGVTNGITEISEHFNIECVRLTDDVGKNDDGHPNERGMQQIEEQIYSIL